MIILQNGKQFYQNKKFPTEIKYGNMLRLIKNGKYIHNLLYIYVCV